MEIIRTNNLIKKFGGVYALNEMNFSIKENEIRCLIGENGCGKSTLIKVISGFHRLDGGELYIFGKKIDRSYSPEDAIHSGIQVIYQDFALFPNMTIAENIMMYKSVSGGRLFSLKKAIESAQAVVDRIRFDVDVTKYVYQLSVAEKQMVAICRALVLEPKLLVMDEPTTALTKKEVDKLFEIVLGLKNEGVSILFVSHKLDEVYRVCDSVTIMRNGKSVFSCESGERIPSKEETIAYMTGHEINTTRMSFDKNDKPVVMSVSGYGLDGAFDDISFDLHEGEVIGITGLLGCGRSELAESLFGVMPATRGKVTVKGKDLSIIGSIRQAMDCGISYVPDDRLTKGLCLKQSIYDNALSCTVNELSNKGGVIDLKGVREFRDEAFTAISIPNFNGDNPVSSLSGGNQQKVVLIKWLATNPSVLILNCPTVGVDVGAKSEILSLVADLAREKGVGVIVISDDSYELLQICSRILIMKDGRIAHEVPSLELSVDDLEDMINSEGEAAV